MILFQKFDVLLQAKYSTEMITDLDGLRLIVLAIGTVAIFAAFVVQVYYYLHYFSAIIANNRKSKRNNLPAHSSPTPPVSVIICARNEEDNLREFLPKVLEQDYPDFEVIVVNDASEDNTSQVLDDFAKLYPHLYVTNMPNDINIISRKKLAVTVGVKAAKNELLLMTDADCYPASKDWIRSMVSNVTDGIEFVVGYGDYITERSIVNRLITYDTLFIAMQYMGFALRGKPYMAVGRNFLYRKSTFYKYKGFAGHLHIVSGDDDLLINKAGNATNTAVATRAESKTMSVAEPTMSKWLLQKSRHLTSSSLYTKSSRRRIGGEVASRALFYLLVVCGLAYADLYVSAFVLSLFVLRYAMQAVVINKTAKRLQSRRYSISILIFDIVLPVISLWLMIKGYIRKK
jgi:transmembrane glycosyl transferase